MGLQLYQKNLLEKLKESLGAVLPIIGIVLVLCFSIAPIPNSVLMTFVVGAVLLIIGMMFFTLGAEMAMTPMGERIGTKLTNTRKISVVIVLCFILGFIITISEPDLQVLAEQVPSIPNYTLIIAVATGVGIFLVAAVLRMLFGIPLAHMLLILYPIIFILASIVPQDFLTVAFDSGGVTTGPMTVPFIMALGIGFSAVRSDKHAENDSFGLVALCSVGPILAVLLLGLLYHTGGSGYEQTMIVKTDNSVEMWQLFQEGLPYYMKEMLISLLPIILFFFIFQIVSLHLHKKTLVKIIIGIIYTYIGLVLFLTGVNVGFMPAGNYLGQVIAGLSYPWIIVPLSSIGGEKTLHFLIQSEKFEREEESTLKETEYELLVAIANQGCIDTVMDVARSVGAGGGTVIHAKGTGMETAEKFLGVSLAAEKEIILIVTRKKQKNAIMKAMMEQTGLASKEKTIIFSLPVTSTVGLRMYIDEMDMDEEEKDR